MQTLTDLRIELANLPALTHLTAALTPGRSGWLRVAPLPTAARTPVVAALATRSSAPLLYLVSNPDQALRATADLRAWLEPDQVLLYPANDTMPYEHMSPGIDILSQRLRVLQMLAALCAASSRPQAATPVIVAPIQALLQPTLTPAELSTATVDLQREAVLSQETLLRRWIDLGYRVAPTVEEPGEVNRRGGIVDIWPPADEQPLRIEWFGDEIDSLRRFDPQSQRSELRLEAATVGPPHEIPLWRQALALARLATLDVDGLRREARDEWDQSLVHLEQGESFAGRSFYAPFFRAAEEQSEMGDHANGATHPQSPTLLDHLPSGTAVICSEAVLLAQTAAELHDQAAEQRATLSAAGELPPAFPRPYLLWEELLPPVGFWAAPSGPGDMPAPAGDLRLVDFSNNEDLDPSGDGATTGRPGHTFDMHVAPADLFGGQLRRLVKDIVARLRAGERVIVVSPQAARMQELVAEAFAQGDKPQSPDAGQQPGKAAQDPAARVSLPDNFLVIHGSLDAGWRLPELGLTLYTDSEIFGWRQRRPLSERQRRKERSADERAAFLRGLKEGDYVVHIEHGIAVYEGLLRRSVGGIEREYLSLRYAAGDRLYVPVDQVDRVARYIGAGDAAPQLTRLGTQEWERAKRKARAAVQDLANDLLALYAKRQLSEGHSFSPDNEWQRDLENAFPYIETDDQLRALTEVKQDMEQTQPMDRLICGDVGFGKTEVALRAAFKALQDGKQVAVLVPTTVLAQQHYDTFTRRMAAFPVDVEMLSRFRSAKEQTAILQRLLRGNVDIIIGTHRLLSKDVHFKDLGLVIVDEEQRFGVRHKERLKQLRAHVDVLTLTATPIPRTLHMSLAGIRDLSVIDTPPQDRVPIKTYVAPYEDQLVRDAILREIDRGGQVYFVHNRVQSIYHVATRLRHLVPEADIGVGHGQLDERQLEKVMLDFFGGKYDVLVCTTIIESGLDVPNANTIIIDDATMYGLAQLYQLRGRVGRSANRAYAYLLYKREWRMTEEAQQRLEAIQEATELGAGFRIAMRDLEIRGAGNLLGAEQSGHIAAVGFDLYSRLLEQAVKQMKQGLQEQQTRQREEQPGEEAANEAALSAVLQSPGAPKVNEKVLVSPLVTLDLPLTAYLPEEYIADDQVRLSVYQRMVEALAPDEVRSLRQELRDRFGEPPEPAAHLLTWLRIKALALNAGVNSVITTDEEFIIRLPVVSNAERERLRRRFGRDKSIKVGPQFVRLDRRRLGDAWVEKLTEVLDLLGRDTPAPPPTTPRQARTPDSDLVSPPQKTQRTQR